jgi:hypothetical protein
MYYQSTVDLIHVHIPSHSLKIRLEIKSSSLATCQN